MYIHLLSYTLLRMSCIDSEEQCFNMIPVFTTLSDFFIARIYSHFSQVIFMSNDMKEFLFNYRLSK